MEAPKEGLKVYKKYTLTTKMHDQEKGRATKKRKGYKNHHLSLVRAQPIKEAN